MFVRDGHRNLLLHPELRPVFAQQFSQRSDRLDLRLSHRAELGGPGAASMDARVTFEPKDHPAVTIFRPVWFLAIELHGPQSGLRSIPERHQRSCGQINIRYDDRSARMAA